MRKVEGGIFDRLTVSEKKIVYSSRFVRVIRIPMCKSRLAADFQVKILILCFTLIWQSAKVSKYHQIIKIRFSTQSLKISAVSTPILTTEAPFFSIFRDLPENFAENLSKFQKLHKTFAQNFGNSAKISIF